MSLAIAVVVGLLIVALAGVVWWRRRTGSIGAPGRGQPAAPDVSADAAGPTAIGGPGTTSPVPRIEGVVPRPVPPGAPLHVAPLPVVLVHGLFGFDRIGVPGARFDYFRGIAKPEPRRPRSNALRQ